MGPQAAARFLLGAEWWSAAQCKADRLVYEVFPDDGFLERVLAFARELARLPLASLLETKNLLLGPHRAAMHRANADENAALGRLHDGAANREAVAAFRERRAADFSNL
jgi:enoyl-CoA hydratase/carnithine racemase